MEYVKIIVAALVSFAALFILTKIMGNRQMSQVSMFDYVSSIAIGSIAGEMAVMSTDSILKPLAAMLVLTLLTLIVSHSTCKSIILRRFFEGHVVLLFQNGQVYERNLLSAKMDIDELLSACRVNGYFDLEEVHAIYLETNGQISVIPKSKNRPVTPSDLKLDPIQDQPLPNVIMDGNIMSDSLGITGKDEKWIIEQLQGNDVFDIKEVILATYDRNSERLNIYLKYHKKYKLDIFE